MKKIKLLTSLGTLTAIGSGMVIINTGCSNKNDDKPTPPLDSKLLITFDYSDADVVAPNETVTWNFNISYNSTPDTLKKLEVTSSDTSVATVDVPDPTKQSFTITDVAAGETDITVKVTDTNDRYNETTHTVYIAGETVTDQDNYVRTVYGTYKIDYAITQIDIDELVPNNNKKIIISGAEISPEIVTELHIVNVLNNAVLNLPAGFLKGCTNLKRINLSGIKTTSIQNTYLAKPVIGEFSINRLEEIVVPEIVAANPKDEIIITDFLSSDGGMPSLTKVDLTGFKNVKRIKGWWACSRCTALTDINLEAMENLVEVGVAFMYGCTVLKNINLSKWTKVQVIRNSFMFGCTSLESVDMSAMANLKVIGAEFLKGCTGLKTFTFPGDSTNKCAIQSIGWDTECNDWAKVYGNFLSGCTSLESIDFSSLDPSMMNGINNDVYKVDADFKKDNFPKRTFYSAVGVYPGSSEASYILLGCEKLKSVNFGSLDTTQFGYAYSSSNIDITGFYTKSFATEAEAVNFIETSTDVMEFEGEHVDHLVDSDSGYSLFQSGTEPLQIGNRFYVREWMPKHIEPVETYDTKNCSMSEDGLEVDSLTGSETAFLKIKFSFPISGGTWTIKDTNGNDIVGTSFRTEGKIGTLTIDSTATIKVNWVQWNIKCNGSDIPVNDFSIDVKKAPTRIDGLYSADGTNFVTLENGGTLPEELIENTSKVKITVKNAEDIDNLKIVSCINPNIGTLTQSNELGAKNEAEWAYKTGLDQAQLVVIAAYDVTQTTNLPIAEFWFYNTGNRNTGYTSNITCDQTDSFEQSESGIGAKAYWGKWTNPDSTAVKTVTWNRAGYYSEIKKETTVYTTYYNSTDWTTEASTSGTISSNNITPTFAGTGTPPSSITFNTTVNKTAKTSIMVVYFQVSFGSETTYGVNYVLYIDSNS